MPRGPVKSFVSARRIAAALGLFVSAIGIPVAHAADLRVISAGAVRSVLGGMVDDFAASGGHTIKLTIGSTGQLRAVIAAGEPADLVIASQPLMADLERTGRMLPASRVDIGRIGLGVVVRDGATAPNVSTAAALKQALIDARSIAYTAPKLGGTSYLHLMKLATQFGIADLVTAKGVDATGGDDAVSKVADGEAEMAIVLVSEIHTARAKLVAMLPESLQSWTIYSAAIPATSSQPALARSLIDALTGPAMRGRWLLNGWQLAG